MLNAEGVLGKGLGSFWKDSRPLWDPFWDLLGPQIHPKCVLNHLLAPKCGPSGILMALGQPIRWIWEAQSSPDGPQTLSKPPQMAAKLGPKLVKHWSKIDNLYGR